jgi:hypothetical protein
VNANELIVKKKYEELGYTVIHNGPPDFLIFRRDSTGMTDIGFIEVKSRKDTLKTKQSLWGCALKSLHLNYRMQYPDEDAIELKKEYFSFVEAHCPYCKHTFNSYHMKDDVIKRFSTDNDFHRQWDISKLLNEVEG